MKKIEVKITYDNGYSQSFDVTNSPDFNCILNASRDKNGNLDGGIIIEKGRVEGHVDPCGEPGEAGVAGYSCPNAMGEPGVEGKTGVSCPGAIGIQDTINELEYKCQVIYTDIAFDINKAFYDLLDMEAPLRENGILTEYPYIIICNGEIRQTNSIANYRATTVEEVYPEYLLKILRGLKTRTNIPLSVSDCGVVGITGKNGRNTHKEWDNAVVKRKR